MNGEKLYVKGPQNMQGELLVQGSKNAALPILAAVLLGSGVFVLHHCPRITDVDHMLEILEETGCRIRKEGHMLIIDTRDVCEWKIQGMGAGKMRSTVTLLGSILGRMREVEIPYPGGCTIGKRPIDLHLKGLEQLGVVFERKEYTLCGHAEKLKGAEIRLDFPSVGATENSMLAAVLAKGETVIRGAAMEPEIVELAAFLKTMGAEITGEGTPLIRIKGVKELHAAEYVIPADRIVAGTYLLGAVMNRGMIRLLNLETDHLGMLPEVLRKLGAKVEVRKEERWISAEMKGEIQPIPYMATAPFPGFPTDLQSALLAVLAYSSGSSVLEEKIFEARFQTVSELQKMKADIQQSQTKVLVEGKTMLCGAELEAKELRGGAALVMAAVAAEGESWISGMEFVKRGYEDLGGDLKKLGIVVNYV